MEGEEAPADGVITGYGKVDGRLVAVAAYDFTVMAGSMGMTGELKITRLRELALPEAHPAHLAAGLGRRAHPGGGRLAVRRLRAPLPRGGGDERRDPAGRRADGAVRRRHRLHPRPRRLRADGQGPRLDGARRAAPDRGRDRRGRHPGGARRLARAHAASPAWATSRSTPTRSASRRIKELPLLHAAELRGGARRCASPPTRSTAGTRSCSTSCPSPPRKPYDMYEVIRRIVDDGEWFDLKPHWARTIITCLARMGGRPVGIVANQPQHLGGILDNDSADKAARFINLCDAFGIPLLFLMDVPGFMVGHQGRAARASSATGRRCSTRSSRATVPKITVRDPQGLRRRLLRDVRPGLRAGPDRRLAERRDLRDGRRGRGGDHLPQADRGGRGPGRHPRRDDRGDPRQDRSLHRGGQRHDRRRHRPARDAARP